MIRSAMKIGKPFAPNSLKIPTRQHRCNKATPCVRRVRYPSWNPMLPIHAQGCKCSPKLCTTFTEGMLQGIESIEGKWKLKARSRRNGGHLTDDISIDRWTPRAA